MTFAQAPPPPEDLTFLESFARSLSSSDFWFQVVVMVGLAPVWFPILRAIYRELNRSLRDQGGVFGRDYTELERERLAASDDPASELPLKSVPHGPRETRAGRAAPSARASSGARGDGRSAAKSGGRAGPPLRSSRGRGF